MALYTLGSHGVHDTILTNELDILGGTELVEGISVEVTLRKTSICDALEERENSITSESVEVVPVSLDLGA